MKIKAFVRSCGQAVVRSVKVAAVATVLTAGAVMAPSAHAVDSQMITDLTTAQTAIGTDVSGGLGLGLKIGILIIGGALVWKGFKKLTA